MNISRRNFLLRSAAAVATVAAIPAPLLPKPELLAQDVVFTATPLDKMQWRHALIYNDVENWSASFMFKYDGPLEDALFALEDDGYLKLGGKEGCTFYLDGLQVKRVNDIDEEIRKAELRDGDVMQITRTHMSEDLKGGIEADGIFDFGKDTFKIPLVR